MYICSNCQKQFIKWQGQCDGCGKWNSIIEDNNLPVVNKKTNTKRKSIESITIESIDSNSINDPLILSGIHEFDNALGGRLIRGQVILFSGSPGIGKSTLCSQLTERFSEKNLKVLYIAGEESPLQIRDRVRRLQLKHKNVTYISTTDVSEIERYVASKQNLIDIVFIDSIQTLYDPQLNSTSGSVSQISECANRIIGLAKGFNIVTFIIGHITKTGDIAGPKILEHMVDTVLYFEGEKRFEYRILRVEKNRFGPTDEVGLFKMENDGLKEIVDTKELFESRKDNISGSVFSMVLEGTRPVVVEVQALTVKSYFPNPRRTTSGFDLSRLFILLAIIEKKLKISTGEFDVYVNITGGLKVSDPALDLAVIKALISSFKDSIVGGSEIYFGEVGLTGEVRKVYMENKRIKEAKRLGFTSINSYENIKKVNELL